MMHCTVHVAPYLQATRCNVHVVPCFQAMHRTVLFGLASSYRKLYLTTHYAIHLVLLLPCAYHGSAYIDHAIDQVHLHQQRASLLDHVLIQGSDLPLLIYVHGTAHTMHRVVVRLHVLDATYVHHTHVA
jgi:hypothetical protein